MIQSRTSCVYKKLKRSSFMGERERWRFTVLRPILGVKYYRNAKNVCCLLCFHVAHVLSPPARPFLFDLRLARQRIQCGALFWFGAVPFPSFDIWAIFFLIEKKSLTMAGRQGQRMPPGAVWSRIRLKHQYTAQPDELVLLSPLSLQSLGPHCEPGQETEFPNRAAEETEWKTPLY